MNKKWRRVRKERESSRRESKEQQMPKRFRKKPKKKYESDR